MLRRNFRLVLVLTKISRASFCFYTQKNATTKFIDDQLPHTTDSEGKIVPSKDASFISDWDDKFDLSEVRNYKLL